MSKPISALRHYLFHPLMVGGLSLLATGLYAAWGGARLTGEARYFHFLYLVPIMAPFVAFLLERAERLPPFKAAAFLIDAGIIGLALSRVFYPVPLVSGHVLFLTYALLTARRRVGFALAALIWLQVLTLKVVFWHDVVTPCGGVILGCVGATLFRWSQSE